MRGRFTRKGAPAALIGCLLGTTCDLAPARPVVCNLDEILATDPSHQLLCVPAPTGKILPPSCPTAALTSDGQRLLCTSTNSATDTDQDVVVALQQLDGAVNALDALLKPGAKVTSYVGVTATPTSGSVMSGNWLGLIAAARLCANQFGAGAHMCMMDELYQSAASGTLSAASTIPLSWVYMPNWNTPAIFPAQPLQGVADNCAGYTYQSQGLRWRGMLVEWGPLPDGTPGFRWHGGDDAQCYTSHPIACCN